MLDLKGVTAKIGRARECLEALEADMAAFCEYERRRTVLEIERGWPTVLGENEPEVPVDYSIRVGEIAYNLRSALDHLVWQLVIDNGQPPSSRNAFPIFREEDQYRKGTREKLKGVKERHRDAIQWLQPFHEDGVVGSHLWMLNSICNIDKHRQLNVVALHSWSTASLKEGTDPNLTGRMVRGLALVQRLRGTEHEGKVSIEVITDICFMDPELENASMGYGSAIERTGIERPPVAPALWGCLTAVRFVVDRLTSRLMTNDRFASITDERMDQRDGDNRIPR